MHLAPAHGSGLSSAPHSEPHLESLAIIGNISTLRRLSGAGSPPDVISQTRTPPKSPQEPMPQKRYRSMALNVPLAAYNAGSNRFVVTRGICAKPTDHCSWRGDARGSIRSARHAGPQAAAIPTMIRNNAAAISSAGSATVRPNTVERRSRAPPSAAKTRNNSDIPLKLRYMAGEL